MKNLIKIRTTKVLTIAIIYEFMKITKHFLFTIN